MPADRRWTMFADELLRNGRADEALTCYARAAQELRDEFARFFDLDSERSE